MEPPPKSVEDEILTEVGRALNNFSKVEQALEGVFCALADIPHIVGPVIMASIVSLEARLKVCDNTTKVGPLPPELDGIWKQLSALVFKQHKKRHDLAHFRTITRTVGTGKPIFGIEPYGSFGRMVSQETPGKFLTIDQVKERGEAFMDTAVALAWFDAQVSDFRGHHWPPVESRPPEPRLVQVLREKAAQSQKAQSEQPEPSPK